ncbi:protein-L-isoaspartate O-methyltransferase [Patescibacteria group bacterium]|nr:protein-L-isoaspartate O-methyltransferase [Patescibacteria group bacterium]
MTLINSLIQNGYLKTPEIIEAFKKINRKDFLLPEHINETEVDEALPIGYKQTISQPSTVVFMLELLQPKIGDKILDIGSGSGWTTALLAEIVGNQGKVYSIERIPEIKNFGEQNISKYNFIKTRRVETICGNGYEGLSKHAPFNKILVSASAPKAPPQLLAQLKIKGKMVIPVGEQYKSQEIVLYTKISKNNFKIEHFPGFVFVPLLAH